MGYVGFNKIGNNGVRLLRGADLSVLEQLWVSTYFLDFLEKC